MTYDQQMEIALWNRMKDSKDPAELQAYVDRFPQGAFAPLARIVIQRAKREEAHRVAVLREELLEEARKKAAATAAPTVVAAVPTPAAIPTAPPPSPDASSGMEREAMVRLLQGELKRVGCYPLGSTEMGRQDDRRAQELREPCEDPGWLGRTEPCCVEHRDVARRSRVPPRMRELANCGQRPMRGEASQDPGEDEVS